LSVRVAPVFFYNQEKVGETMDREINYVALGERIRQSRKKAKLTQEQLAESISLSVSHVGHIERGSRIPSIDTLVRMSSTLHVSIDYLLLGEFSAEHMLLSSVTAALKSEERLEPKTISAMIRELADKIDVL